MGSVPKDYDHRGYRVYNQSEMAASNQCTGVDNQSMDLDYMSAPFGQYADSTVEYRCIRVVENNS